MTNETLTVETYLSDAALRGQIEREARRERAAAVHACIEAIKVRLKSVVRRGSDRRGPSVYLPFGTRPIR